MITLYHASKSRSSRFIWLLEEIGEPYTIETVALRGREGQTPDPAYRAIHPHGKVPAIQHDGVTIFESAAIALYLSDAFPAAGVGVPIGDKRRGPYLTWLAYYAGVLEPAFVGKANGFTTTGTGIGWAPTEDILAHLVATLERAPFVVGEQFTAADVLYGSTLALFQGSRLLPPNDTINAYVDRIKARPAYQRAAAKD